MQKNNHYICVLADNHREAMLNADQMLGTQTEFTNVFIIGAVDKNGNIEKNKFFDVEGNNFDLTLDGIRKDIVEHNRQRLSLEEIAKIDDKESQLLAYRNYYDHEYQVYTQLKGKSIEDFDLFEDQIYPYEFTDVGLTSYEINGKEQYIVLVVVED